MALMGVVFLRLLDFFHRDGEDGCADFSMVDCLDLWGIFRRGDLGVGGIWINARSLNVWLTCTVFFGQCFFFCLSLDILNSAVFRTCVFPGCFVALVPSCDVSS